MSKKNKNKMIEAAGVNQVVDKIERALNKHGKIKIKGDKKATKQLKAICLHHCHSKKGNLKPTVASDGNSNLTCTMCGAKFTGAPYSDEEIRKTLNKTVELLNHTAFMLVETSGKGADESIKKITTVKSLLSKMDKTCINARIVAAKRDKGKKNKNSGNNGGAGKSTLTSWCLK